MMLAVILAALIATPALGLVTFVQLLYLESMRLRTRDLPALDFFKDTLEDKIGLKTEDQAFDAETPLGKIHMVNLRTTIPGTTARATYSNPLMLVSIISSQSSMRPV